MMKSNKERNAYLFLKRAMDFICSVTGVLVLAPVFLALAVLIKLDSNGPVFFRQRRIGKNKNEFQMLKFRTMRVDAPAETPTHLLQNPDAHITGIGRILRKTSLDELPQLFNILRGEMTIVGPRPALWNQFDLIEERDRYGVNEVLPGITGFAQINGRDELTIEDKAKLDGAYVAKMSLRVDLECILKTAFKVIKGEGVVEGKQAETEIESEDSLK